mgnify:CR=1 FL=1
MNKQKQAFTLVELIVVITILAILWTIAFISLQWYSKDARDSIRISDTSSMKTSLELFHLNSGKYPLPDNSEIVEYESEILWYQWEFGSTVISSLSRSMNEVPTDPLTDKKYIFSVANNKNEFEILSLLEWDSLVLNNILQTSAASLAVTPKIDGTYNRVFIKTASYIVPVPSIITSEILASTMILDSNNITSQVINGWENIPEQWNVVSNTWALTWLVLSVYNWTIAIDDDNVSKEAVIQKIKDAYTGSVLASSDIYEYILNANWELENVELVNSLILKNDTTEVVIIPNTYKNCTWANTPVIWDASILATTIYWELTWNECDTEDIIVCSWELTWYTIAACNVWTTTAAIAFNDANWYWELFQWWNNAWIKTAWTSTTKILVTDIDSTYSGSTFIYNAADWNTTQNDNLWWNWTSTDEARIWPCLPWYHIPTQAEWGWIHIAWWWGSNWVDSWVNISNDLKIPMAGRREWSEAGLYNQGNRGRYWSSSPNGINKGEHINFLPGYIETVSEFGDRAHGFSIRCFKN